MVCANVRSPARLAVDLSVTRMEKLTRLLAFWIWRPAGNNATWLLHPALGNLSVVPRVLGQVDKPACPVSVPGWEHGELPAIRELDNAFAGLDGLVMSAQSVPEDPILEVNVSRFAIK